MNIDSILKNLKSAGFDVSFDDHDIFLNNSTGQAVLDDELKDVIQSNKQEILYHLRIREYIQLYTQTKKLTECLNDSASPLAAQKEQFPQLEALINKISELEPFIQHYKASGLTQWYESGWLLIHSELLNELVVLVKDENVELPTGAKAYPVYLFKEVESLDGKSDEIIRAAHRIKKAFSGEIER